MTQNDTLAGTLNRIAGRRDPVAWAAWFVGTVLLNMTGRLGNVAESGRRTGGSVESPIGSSDPLSREHFGKVRLPWATSPWGSSAPLGREPLGSSALWARALSGSAELRTGQDVPAGARRSSSNTTAKKSSIAVEPLTTLVRVTAPSHAFTRNLPSRSGSRAARIPPNAWAARSRSATRADHASRLAATSARIAGL